MRPVLDQVTTSAQHTETQEPTMACTDPCYQAAAIGDPDALEAAIASGYALTKEAVVVAAAGGHLDALQKMRCICYITMTDFARDDEDEVIPHAAARGGHVHVLEWLYNNVYCLILRHRGFHRGYHGYSANVAAAAAGGGHTTTLQWLRDNGHGMDSNACTAAASGGYLSTLEWLVDNGREMMVNTRTEAECSLMTANTCAEAARSGHHELLKFARAHGAEMDYYTPMKAAEGGHFEIIRWAIDEGALEDEIAGVASLDASLGATLGAALGQRNTKLVQDIVQWLCAKQWPYKHARSLRRAALNGHVDMVAWMCETYGVRPTCETFKAAVEGGHPPMLTWLYEHGCPWDASLCQATAWLGRLDTLMWLRGIGCPWDHRTYQAARERNHGDVELWVRDNGCACECPDN